MNKTEIKNDSKELWKDVGLIILAGTMIYWLGPSWDLFINAPIIEKVFYGIFTLVILYKLLSMVKRIFLKSEGTSLFKRKDKPTREVNQSPSVQEQLLGQPAALPLMEPDISSILQQINKELAGVSITNPESTGKQMIDQIKNKVNNFDVNLDEETNNLESQYQEMEKLRKGINQNVSETFVEYKRLERQMQIVDTMIKTKRLLGEKIRQLKEGDLLPPLK